MESFIRLKKKSMITAIIASIIVGVFSALFAVGVVMLAIKLSANKLAWFFYLIIGIVGFLLSGGITFLIIRPTDKSVAKKLDNEYGLNERTQTMLEFKEQDSTMLRLQREDAEARLKNLPKKEFSLSLIKSLLKKIWQYIVIIVVGLSLFLAGILVPSRYVPPFSDGFTYNDWEASTLEQLIEDIKNSQTEEKVKLPIVESLTLLNEELKTTTLKSEMKQKVKACAKSIDEAVILANSYRAVAEALNSYKELNDFKNALIKAADSYKNDYKITSITEVDTRAKNAEDGIRDALNAYVNAFDSDISEMPDVISIREKVVTFLTPYNEALSEDALLDNKLLDKLRNDSLYEVMSKYSTELGNKALLYQYQSTSLSYAKELVSVSNSNYVSGVSKPLTTQVYNRMIDELVLNTLSDLFGVSVSPEDLSLPGNSDNDGSSDTPSQGGAVGDEKNERPSNDTIFDPDSNAHVQYGTVWNAYMTRLYNRLNDPDYEISDEMRAYIKQYIKILSGDSNIEE